MSALIVNNDVVHYEVLGRGRPLVFLHGWVGSWRDWLPTMQALSSTYRCYALDLWGYGDSAKSPSRYTAPSQVELVETFMQELGIMKIALLGHGFGSVIAAQFAGKFPNLVDRALLVGYPHTPSAIHQRLKTDPVQALYDWLLGDLPNTTGMRSEAVKMDPEVLRRSIRELSGEFLLENMHSAASPRLFVYGETDPAIAHPPETLLENLSYHTHYITLDQNGHYPMIGDPARFSRLAKDFLTLEPQESPRNLQLKDEWKRRFR